MLKKPLILLCALLCVCSTAFGYRGRYDKPYLPLSGGTMRGDINMNGNLFTNVGGLTMAGNILFSDDVSTIGSATTNDLLTLGAGVLAVNGTLSSGNITISSPTPILVFKDSDSLGAASVGYIEWRDSGGGRAGFLGNNTSGNDDLLWKNEQGGNIGIETTGAGEFQVEANTVLSGSLDMGDGDITNAKSLFINMASGGYKIQPDSGDVALSFARTSAAFTAVRLFAFDDNVGADSVRFEVFGLGGMGGIANRERLVIGWDATGTQYRIWSESKGSGTTRDIALYTSDDDGAANTDQFLLSANGNNSMSGDLSFSATKGLSGSLAWKGSSTLDMDDGDKIFKLPASVTALQIGGGGMAGYVLTLNTGTSNAIVTLGHVNGTTTTLTLRNSGTNVDLVSTDGALGITGATTITGDLTVASTYDLELVDGSIGIDTAPTAIDGIKISGTRTTAFTGVSVADTYIPASGITNATAMGFALVVNPGEVNTNNIASVLGAAGAVTLPNASGYGGTIATMAGVKSNVNIAGNTVGSGWQDPTVTEGALFLGAATLQATIWKATVTNFYGMKLTGLTGHAQVGSLYGLYLGAVSGAATANWAIYSAGGNSFLTDKLFFGQTDGTIGVYSQADSFLDLFADGAVRIGDSSAGAPTNYSKFEDDGTLEFNGTATVWDDYVTPMSRALFGGSSNDPTLTKIADDGAGSAGVWAFVFGDGDEVLATVQMPHSWKEGSTIYPHIHFFTMTDVSPSDNFDMDFEYWWADIGEDFPANTTLVTTTHATGIDSQYLHQFGNLTVAGIDGSGHTLSSVLMIRIERQVSAGDNYAGGVAIIDFDIHFEKDTAGSRTISAK